MPDNENEQIESEFQREPAREVEQSAAARQRAFEDDYFGKDEVRIDGAVQRGHGSLFARLKPDVKTHYHALEQAVAAEKEISEARNALAGAEKKAETAEARVKATAGAVEKWPDKAQA